MADLTAKQQQILEFIITFQENNGFCPSVREIGEAVKLNSTSSVHNNLVKLEQKGYVRKDPSKSRSLEILRHPNGSETIADQASAPTASWTYRQNSPAGRTTLNRLPQISAVPILGKIHPGMPLLSLENIIDYYPVPVSVIDHENCFLLRADDDGMVKAGIWDGDLVLVKMQSAAADHDLVVVMLGASLMIKTYYKEKNMVRLVSENDYIEPIILRDCQVLGKVIGLYRSYP